MKLSTKILIFSIIGFLPFQLIGQEQLMMAPKVAQSVKNGTRTLDGSISENYWSNHPHYFLDINFNPETYMLDGSGTIKYDNNSPDTLKELTIALLGNIYKDDILRDWNIKKEAVHDGTVITRLNIDGNAIDITAKNVRISGTNMFVTLDQPMLPKTQSTIELEWHVLFPLGAVIRSGNFGDSTFFISYFYPKIAVYDDIDGWDRTNYKGSVEFYGEYSDFDVNISLPGDFFLWSTGELQNPKEVYTKKMHKKWKKAKKSDEVISMIDSLEVGDPKTYKSLAKQTWNIKAKNVTDFAFGCSNQFMWDARSVVVDKKAGRRSFVHAAYRPSSMDYREVADITANALDHFSNQMPAVPYPYPVMSVFNGNSGMEFPMMCNDASQAKRINTVGLTYHEVAHSYFPFYIGINERKYAWMDEGWASFFPPFFYDQYDSSFEEYFEKREAKYLSFAGDEGEVPLMLTSRAIHGRNAYRNASYNKSFLAYYNLMEYLGKEEFKKALQGYMSRWNGKHPIPYDFFYSINHFTGQNLNWYWENWFFDKNHADLGIGDVKDGAIEIINHGRLFLPIHLEVTYKDGSKQVYEKDLSIWNNDHYRQFIPIENMADIKTIKLGKWDITDVDKSNNVVVK